jgi:hypothetical protein
MTAKFEHDWPPTMRPRRRPMVLEPASSIRARFTVTRERRPSPWAIAAIVIGLLVLWRFKLGLLMLAALVGPERIEAAMFVVALLAMVAWWQRRSGRPF